MSSDYDKQLFKTRNAWRTWLEDNHSSSSGIWLIYNKKHTGKPSVNYNEAVEEALCFGWIDSLVKRIDEEKYMQKFTPRNDKSLWSVLNKKRVEKMISEGKMTQAGLNKIKIAKQNGKWYEETDSKKAYAFSNELFDILRLNGMAFSKFESLSKTNKKNFITWVMYAKKQETRERRMNKMIEMLNKGIAMF